jgi:DNA-directed RNA polymerase specialized sigma24 family protein
MDDSPKLSLQGDEAQLFDEFDATLRWRVQREVNTSHANVEDACAFAWLQFLRNQPDRDRAWRAWLVQVARREAYRLSRVESREPIRLGLPGEDGVHSNRADPRADSHQVVEVHEALELLAELRPRLRPIAFLRATGHSHAQIQEVTGLSRSRVGQLVQSAHDGLWEAAAERRRAEVPQAPRAERLRSLEEHPPAWLVEKLGRPPGGRDQATRLQLWRRAALALDDCRERVASREREPVSAADDAAFMRLHEMASRAEKRYRDASDRGMVREGIVCER